MPKNKTDERETSAAKHRSPNTSDPGEKYRIEWTTPSGNKGHGAPMSLEAAQEAVQTTEKELRKSGRSGVLHKIRPAPGSTP